MRQNELIGRKVAGRFTIKSFLGEGGMATVYLAEQEGEPREVALKIMNEELNADRTFVKRFQREAKAAARVQHPNSVTFIDYGVADGLSYIAMELLRGDDLYVLLERDGAISQLRAARILIEVCDALSVAHELGIVHRDLKPENVMVLPDASHPNGERVKVLDFGIAKLLAPDTPPPVDGRADPPSGVTRAGTFIGTPSYMSPEQCSLQPVDTRADLYTCGVLLFQLVTGRLPFEGQTPLHTATLHIHEAPPRPATFAPTLDARLEAVILKALAKKPADRHQTARHMASMLRKILPDLPDVRVATAGKPPGSLRPSGRTRNLPPPAEPPVTMGGTPMMPPAAPAEPAKPPAAPRPRMPPRPPARPPEPVKPPGALGVLRAAPVPNLPVIAEDDSDDDDGRDSDRTLVRPPTEEEAPRRELTEVVAPPDEAPARPPPPAPPPPASRALGPPATLRPAPPDNAPARPPPRLFKPTLKSAGAPEPAPSSTAGEDPARPPPAPATLLGVAPPEKLVALIAAVAAPPNAGAGEALEPPAGSSPEISGAPVVPVGSPASLGAAQLGSAQMMLGAAPASVAPTHPGQPSPPVEPAPVSVLVEPQPDSDTNAFDATTKMDASAFSQPGGPLGGIPPGGAVPGGFIPTAQTVPLIPPELVASAIARGPRPAAGAPAIAPASQVFAAPAAQGYAAPQTSAQGYAPPSAQGYAPAPVPAPGYAPQGYAPAPVTTGGAPVPLVTTGGGPVPLVTTGGGPVPPAPLAPPTPPVFPMTAAPSEPARISSARGLLLGFLAGAVLMAVVAAVYFLTQ